MTAPASQFLFASAPDSWGVLDYPGPSWNQSYEKMLDEMVEAGYTGTELGPYGYFPTDPEALRAQLEKRKLKLLGSSSSKLSLQFGQACSVLNRFSCQVGAGCSAIAGGR